MLTDGIICPPPVWKNAVPVEALLTTITIDNPEPISINKAYTVWHGKETLSAAGRKYKDSVRMQVAQASFQWKAGVNGIHETGGYVELHITVYLAEFFNKSWKPGAMTKPRKSKKTGKRAKPKRRNPYQQVDVGNYLKLLEDGVVKGCGIDDCNHLDIHLYKREDLEHPRVEVIHRVMMPA
jgi:Holliday junction resolvase RusA-like endonuclease